MDEPTLATEKARRDYRLVCAAREKGDEKAFASLMALYKEPLYQMLLRMTGDTDEADDLAMEAFGKAFCQLHLYTPTNAFSTWLFSIGVNSCIDRIRRRRLPTVPISTLEERNDDDGYEFPVPSSGRNPEEEIIAAQRVKRMRDVVAQLKPAYRRVIELRYFDELSYEEIAQRLEIPMGTVKVHLMRARQLLANIISSQSEPM